ncbi:MAG: capsule assembly Wzi family protein, partial [Alphaproteobacteria bacterium]
MTEAISRTGAFRGPMRTFVAALVLSALAGAPAAASPWLEPGDDLARRDVEILAGYGLMDGLTAVWPIPWRQVSRAFGRAEGRTLPPHVRNALTRLRTRYEHEAKPSRPKVDVRAQLASEPRLVRGFRDTARDEIDLEVGVEYMWNSTAIRLNAGLISDFKFKDASPNLDRSYIAQELGGWLLYAGAIEEWWGSGNVSSINRSNNARPHPRVGIMRNDTQAFETPWLSWIGPWQFGTALGVLDDNRVVNNPFIWDMFLSVEPVQGLQLSAFRTTILCGEDTNCSARRWYESFFGLATDGAGGFSEPSTTAGADVRYTTPVGDVVVSAYGKYIGSDRIDGWPGKASFLTGMSLAGFHHGLQADWQLVAEVSDTRARLNGGNTPNANSFYDHSYYRSGYRYRGRSLGHSLDQNAILYSLAGMLVDSDGWRWRGALHRA